MTTTVSNAARPSFRAAPAGAVAAISSPWYRRVRRPATVPQAYPPRPSVTSHSRDAASSRAPHPWRPPRGGGRPGATRAMPPRRERRTPGARRPLAGPPSQLPRLRGARERVWSTDQVGHDPGPARLVTGPQTCAVVAVEVLVERDVVAPSRVVLQLGDPSVAGAAAVVPPHEERDETLPQVLGTRAQRHRPTAAGRVLGLELAAERPRVSLEVAQQQEVDRHPHRSSPVRVAAEHPGVRLPGLVVDGDLPAGELERDGILLVELRQRPEPVRRQELVLVEHARQHAATRPRRHDTDRDGVAPGHGDHPAATTTGCRRALLPQEPRKALLQRPERLLELWTDHDHS